MPASDQATTAKILPRTAFLMIAAVWLFVICGLTLFHQVVKWQGTPVILALAPVDPFDPFRGEYVRLRFDISSPPTTGVMMGVNESELQYDQKLYVILSPEVPARVIGVEDEIPAKGQVFIQGKITSTHPLRIEYGIEQYFVEQGQGPIIEQIPANEMTARVYVNGRGRPVLDKLLRNGQEL